MCTRPFSQTQEKGKLFLVAKSSGPLLARMSLNCIIKEHSLHAIGTWNRKAIGTWNLESGPSQVCFLRLLVPFKRKRFFSSFWLHFIDANKWHT